MPINAHAATLYVHRVIEPTQCYLRRHRLLTDDVEALPVAQLRPNIRCFDGKCSELIANWSVYTGKYKRTDKDNGLSLFRPTAAMLDLSAFATIADFDRLVSKASKGNDNRSAKKAARLGYASRMIAAGSYGGSIATIQKSMRFRSGGPVLGAFFRSKGISSDHVLPYRPPVCNEHWTIEWAVFAPTDQGGGPVAHAVLRRVGNMVRTMAFMGHGDHLKQGVVKLLAFDIVHWLLARLDPCVQDVCYFLYGAMEHGNQGLFDWKRRMQFRPFVLDTSSYRDCSAS